MEVPNYVSEKYQIGFPVEKPFKSKIQNIGSLKNKIVKNTSKKKLTSKEFLKKLI